MSYLQSIYLRDRARGTTVEVTAGLYDDRYPINDNVSPSISDDGRFVAFHFIGWHGVGVDAVPNAYLYDVRRAHLRLVEGPRTGRVDVYLWAG